MIPKWMHRLKCSPNSENHLSYTTILSYKRQLFTQVRKEKQRVVTPKIIHHFGRSVYNRNFSFFLRDLCVLCGEMLFFQVYIFWGYLDNAGTGNAGFGAIENSS
jgi:hypothetical protein